MVATPYLPHIPGVRVLGRVHKHTHYQGQLCVQGRLRAQTHSPGTRTQTNGKVWEVEYRKESSRDTVDRCKVVRRKCRQAVWESARMLVGRKRREWRWKELPCAKMTMCNKCQHKYQLDAYIRISWSPNKRTVF